MSLFCYTRTLPPNTVGHIREGGSQKTNKHKGRTEKSLVILRVLVTLSRQEIPLWASGIVDHQPQICTDKAQCALCVIYCTSCWTGEGSSPIDVAESGAFLRRHITLIVLVQNERQPCKSASTCKWVLPHALSAMTFWDLLGKNTGINAKKVYEAYEPVLLCWFSLKTQQSWPRNVFHLRNSYYIRNRPLHCSTKIRGFLFFFLLTPPPKTRTQASLVHPPSL